MSKFDKAMEHTREFEGGYVNDPDDPGGPTNWGISLRWLRQQYDEDVEQLTYQQARNLYRKHFWNGYYEYLPQPLATKLFDLGVNMGPSKAVSMFQKLVNADIDGVYGPRTHKDYTTARRTLGPEVDDYLLEQLENLAARYYYSLTQSKPTLKRYLNGWLRRAYA